MSEMKHTVTAGIGFLALVTSTLYACPTWDVECMQREIRERDPYLNYSDQPAYRRVMEESERQQEIDRAIDRALDRERARDHYYWRD